ncbi:OmpA/MotB family protein [Nesterenkonia populi]|uniref:OmpA/MotB family protein n=1 Tax=Nesterenkonia populi TaxID=1591087 RepID=UPI0011BFDC4C|nr:flagellar motor protein MotB [Nesterenkonia populi]
MAGEGSAIRSGSPRRARSRRRSEEVRDNPDRWMASYMDVVTVLMCLFIVLYAMSTVDEDRYEALRLSLATGFGRDESELVEDTGLLISEEFAGDEDLTIFEEDEDAEELEDELVIAQQEYDDLMELKQQLRLRLEEAGHEESVDFTLDEQGLHVHLVGAETFFDPYESTLSEEGVDIMGIVAPVIAPTDRFFEVGGHADERQPLHTYPTNWELSSARATSALRQLVEEGDVDPARIVSVGYGHEHPMSEELWRNRRVDVSILSDQPDQVRELLPEIRDAAQAGEELSLEALLEASD